jgi:hypothetical protein
MVFYVEPEPGSGKRIARNPEADRLQKLENATFVTTELGRFSKTLDNEFANRVNAGGARGASFAEDLKHLGLGMIEDGVAGIEKLPNGRPRIDGTGRVAFKERARGILELKLAESRKLLARQSERDALGALAGVGEELNQVAGRRPHDFAAIRENLGRAVDDFAGVFGAEREAAIRRELDDDLFVARLKGMTPSDLDGALAELNDPANLPEHGTDEREELASRLRRMTAALKESPELAEGARRAETMRESAVVTARLDAALVTAESVGSVEAVRQARAALNAAAVNGGLPPTRFDTALVRLQESEAAPVAREGRIERIEALLEENATPDGTSEEDKLAVDEHFTAYHEGLAELPESERILAQATYAGRVGMMPADLADEIEGGLLAKDPEAQVVAAKRFALIEKQLPEPCPEGVFHFVSCERARELIRLDRMGVAPERAVELVDRAFPLGAGPGGVRTFEIRPDDELAAALLLAAKAPAGHRAGAGSNDRDAGDAPEVIAGAGGNETLVGGDNQDNAKDADVSQWAIPDMPPPTDEPVDFEEWRERLNFDPEAPGDVDNLLNIDTFGSALTAKSLGDEAERITKERFQGEFMGNSSADAFRHALWSYTVTEELGPELAKQFLDGHEAGPFQENVFDLAGDPNRPGIQLMDLYNNNVGRLLALDPANKDRDPVEVVIEALEAGRLQTAEFNVK